MQNGGTMEEKYQKLLYWFKEISKIPRNSKEEEKIAEWICNFAKERNLEYYKDELHNVLIKKNASKGYEQKKPIILQAHTDMVCVKDEGIEHDFTKDSIEIIESKDTYIAKGTSLGADDGIGVAYLLLILDDNSINHPEINCLFTTQEEIGMDGAGFFDYSKIKADYLINVDNEEENTATVGCAGGVRLEYLKNIQMTKIRSPYVRRLKISGLSGGHSGVDIDKKRINANFLAAYILKNYVFSPKIVSFNGGTKDNAIANSVEVEFITPKTPVNGIETFKEDLYNNEIPEIKLTEADKNINIEIERKRAIVGEKGVIKTDALSNDDSREFLELILSLKQGVVEMNKDKSGFVETSGNIGIVKTKKTDNVNELQVNITELVRSSDDSKKNEVKRYNNDLAKSLGYLSNEESDYHGWKYKTNSKIEQVYKEVYKQTHNGEEPIINIIHAGVECGLIYKKMPNLELISIGPDLKDVHTTRETLYLKSCKKLLETLLLLIDKLD